MNIDNKNIKKTEDESREAVIRLTGISKKYNLYNNKQDRLKEALHPCRKKFHKEFYALRGIDLEVKKGESVGILGMNGAGKSTLLKVITGVTMPTSGTRLINGNISALLELGSGFNPEFSGYENVFFYGALMGFTEKQMNEKIDEILEFADIGEYIYQPIKTYSSGMKSRLAFAVATSIEPDILILDEVLAVGDMFFQAKCTERMQSMIKDQNITVLFVSHNIGAVKAICEKSILMQGGKIVSYGPTEDIANEYFNLQVQSRQKVIEKQISRPKKNIEINQKDTEQRFLDFFTNNSEFLKRASYKRIQNGKAEFVNCALLDENENEIHLVEYGQNVILRMGIEIYEDMDKVNVGYHVQNKGVSILFTSSFTEGKFLEDVKVGEKYIIDYKMKLELQHEKYNILLALHVPVDGVYVVDEGVFADYIYTAYQFQMVPARPRAIFGFVHIEQNVSIKKIF